VDGRFLLFSLLRCQLIPLSIWADLFFRQSSSGIEDGPSVFFNLSYTADSFNFALRHDILTMFVERTNILSKTKIG